jgi:hypothetical protein
MRANEVSALANRTRGLAAAEKAVIGVGRQYNGSVSVPNLGLCGEIARRPKRSPEKLKCRLAILRI